MLRLFIHSLAITSVLLYSIPTRAQGFPEGATTVTGAEIKQRVEDRVMDVKLADGVSWRLEYKSTGYFFVNTSRGFNGFGTWTAEDGKLCTQFQGAERNCNEVRLYQDILQVKRNSGEVIRLVPR